MNRFIFEIRKPHFFPFVLCSAIHVRFQMPLMVGCYWMNLCTTFVSDTFSNQMVHEIQTNFTLVNFIIYDIHKLRWSLSTMGHTRTHTETETHEHTPNNNGDADQIPIHENAYFIMRTTQAIPVPMPLGCCSAHGFYHFQEFIEINSINFSPNIATIPNTNNYKFHFPSAPPPSRTEWATKQCRIMYDNEYYYCSGCI